MKTHLLSNAAIRTKLRYSDNCTLILALLLLSFNSFSQKYLRVYAVSETHSSALVTGTSHASDPGQAIGGNTDDFSTLSFPLTSALADHYQQLTFPATTGNSPANTDPVHVKLGINSGLLATASSVELQAYNGSTAVGSPVNVASLLVLLSGEAIYDLVVPAPGVPYNSVRITTKTLLSIGPSVRIYEAYINKTASSDIACNEATDAIYGFTSNVASTLNSIADPKNAIDNNDGTFALLHSVLSAGSKTYLTSILSSVVPAGDNIRVVAQLETGVIDATILANGIRIATFLGNSDATIVNSSASLITVNILSGPIGNPIAEFLIPSTVAFDRIEVSLGTGLVSALSALKVYDISSAIKTPVVTTQNVTIYTGKTASLSATPGNGDGIIWLPSGATGNPYITPALTDNTSYEVQAIRPGCTNRSASAIVNVTVLPLPVQNLLPDGSKDKPYTSTNVISSNPGGRYLIFSSADLTSKTGLQLSSSGIVSGTPSANGIFEINVNIVDAGPGSSLGEVATFTYSITIADPLPVTLISFKARSEAQTAVLIWSTSAETNSDGFHIERSKDGKAWTKIGNVQSNHESNSIQHYFFSDTNPINGEILYRLKMVDYDGTFAYSHIESLSFSLQDQVTLYPNPVLHSEELRMVIHDRSKVTSVKIISSTGKIVSDLNILQTDKIPTHHLVSGLYFVQVIRDNGKTEITRFIKL